MPKRGLALVGYSSSDGDSTGDEEYSQEASREAGGGKADEEGGADLSGEGGPGAEGAGSRGQLTQRRTFEFSCSHSSAVVHIQEIISDGPLGLFVWPSSILLARYIWITWREFAAGKSVLELGAGTALPGLVAAALGARVILTDRSDATEVLANCERCVDINGLQEQCTVMPLNWGEFSAATIADSLRPDVLLGADVFFHPPDFESIIATACFFMRRNPDCVFVTTYQQRDASATIKLLLRDWGMVARVVPMRSFLRLDDEEEEDSGDSGEEQEEFQEQYPSLCLIEIRMAAVTAAGR
jgi:predicted nicotinamide N-methyase